MPADIVRSYSGVRPLYDDHAENASAVTRDYVLAAEGGAGRPVLLSVFGGKITTYRKLAEQALEKLLQLLGRATGAGWTASREAARRGYAGSRLRGLSCSVFRALPVPPRPARMPVRAGLWHQGAGILGAAQTVADLGRDFGGGLFAAEVDYLVAREWAREPEDILWRRSKLGLHVPADTAAKLASYLREAGCVEGRMHLAD